MPPASRRETAAVRLPELEQAKQRKSGKTREARASTTDAQASVMKMADGGFRPAYNVQYASDCASQVVIGVDVVTSGSDMGQLAPMVEQVQQRLGRAPEQWLVDGGYPAHDQIEAVAHKTELYAPVPKPRASRDKSDHDGGGGQGTGQADAGDAGPPSPPAPGSEFEPKATDSAAVAKWRARMGTPQAQAIYRDRAATAECANAQARNHGLQRMPMRGLLKAKSTALLHALAHNLRRMAVLAPSLFGPGEGPSGEIPCAA
jgi:hypothetical protein